MERKAEKIETMLPLCERRPGEDSPMRLLSSKNYGMFKIDYRNRPINAKHVVELEDSINANGYLACPVIVNESMEILDGQHRFMACKNLGIPIYYIVDSLARHGVYTTLNSTQKNWDLADYVRHYALNGNREYIKLSQLIASFQRIEFSSAALVASCSASNPGVQIRKGTFCFFSSYERAERVLDFLMFMTEIYASIGSMPFLTARTWLAMDIVDSLRIDEKVMRRKMLTYKMKLSNFTKLEEGIKALESVYNFKRAGRVSFDGIHEEAMDIRKALREKAKEKMQIS